MTERKLLPQKKPVQLGKHRPGPGDGGLLPERSNRLREGDDSFFQRRGELQSREPCLHLIVVMQEPSGRRKHQVGILVQLDRGAGAFGVNSSGPRTSTCDAQRSHESSKRRQRTLLARAGKFEIRLKRHVWQLAPARLDILTKHVNPSCRVLFVQGQQRRPQQRFVSAIEGNAVGDENAHRHYGFAPLLAVTRDGASGRGPSAGGRSCSNLARVSSTEAPDAAVSSTSVRRRMLWSCV
jgi:hypothetical protein